MVTDTDGWLIRSSMVKNGDYGYCGLLVAIDTLYTVLSKTSLCIDQIVHELGIPVIQTSRIPRYVTYMTT